MNISTTSIPATLANLIDWSDLSPKCSVWQLPQHVFFQLANTFLFVSYLTPPGLYGHLYLRACLTIGSLFYSMFGWVTCAPDIIAWNLLFTTINAIMVLVVIYKIHPFIHFPHEIELVYRDLFEPLKVSRVDFRKLYRLIKRVDTLKPHELYCVEGSTPVDKLSLLLSGRLAVLRNAKTVHMIDSHQFLDSPEWFGVGVNETYQVTIMALEESRLLIWHRDKLKLSICEEPYLQNLLDNILGKDVVKKLLFVTDSMSNGFANGATTEQSKLIVPVEDALDQVVTRSIIAGKKNPYSFWSLTRINEGSEETNV